jgi:transposase
LLLAAAARLDHHRTRGGSTKQLKPLVGELGARLLQATGIGVEIAGQLLVTTGDNPDRVTSEPGFAMLCGAAPLPASSGKTQRHRLNRGGAGRPTAPSTWRSSAACAWTPPPRPTSPDAPPAV